MRRAILLLSALLIALAPPAGAQGDSLRVRSFDADLVVNRDGTMHVTERIRVAFFGAWNGLNRDISLQHENGEGRREKLKVEVESVVDEAGRPYEYEIESDDVWTKRVKIWARSPNNEERTLVVRYTVRNPLRYFFADRVADVGNLDELYWNVTGNDWTMPIDRVQARVILPDGATPKQFSVYTGLAGETGDDSGTGAEVRNAQGIVTVNTLRGLSPGEGVTVAVGWPPGVVTGRPTAEERRRAEALRALLLWPLALPLLAFYLSFRTWRRRGRDPEAQAVVVGYEPPLGLSPSEVGTLVDHRCEMRDVIAILVDLAVRGYVGIEEREEKKLLGLLSETEYVFHLRRPREEWEGLAEHERKFLDALFTSANRAEAPWEVIKEVFRDAGRAREEGRDVDPRRMVEERIAAATTSEPLDSVRLSELQNRFYRSIPGINDAVYESLIKRGFYVHRPDKVKGNWIAGGLVTAFLSIFASVFIGGFGVGFVDPIALGAGGAVAGIVIAGFGMVMPARTEAGARAREAALGFREFLDKVESDRYRRMVTSPEMFERYLPHAMAFGVEGRWAAAFDDLYREPPDWYSGGNYGGFRATTFSSRMSTLSSRAGSTMSSSPSSSGSGGGGSSGGGSGGGGGSGF